MHAPHNVIRAYPFGVRKRLLEKAAFLVEGATEIDRTLDVLLDSFPKDSRTFSELALVRASGLLRRHREGPARQRLEQLHKAFPNLQQSTEWLRALDAPRVGRVALGWPGGGETGGDADRLRPGFWLDGQRSVWLFTGEAESAAGFEQGCGLHSRLNVAGIAPLVAHGVASDGTPYAAVPATGRYPITKASWRRPQRDETLAVCAEGARIFNTLARLGLTLPNADPDRFLHRSGGLLWLADLSGLEEKGDAPARNLELARSFCGKLAANLGGKGGDEAVSTMGAAETLDELAYSLALL